MNLLKPILVAVAWTASAPFAASLHAQSMGHDMPGGMTMPGKELDKMPAAMADGEVRRVDKDNRKITLKHGEIKNLDMPSMTMVFQVKDAAMLEQVKAGDKVKFTAEAAGGAIVVTSIEVAK